MDIINQTKTTYRFSTFDVLTIDELIRSKIGDMPVKAVLDRYTALGPVLTMWDKIISSSCAPRKFPVSLTFNEENALLQLLTDDQLVSGCTETAKHKAAEMLDAFKNR